MNIEFTVALDTPAQQRDIEFHAGDDFTLTVKVFASDKDDGALPLPLTGDVLTIEALSYPSHTFTAAGNVFTFHTPQPDGLYYRDRTPYRIVLTDENGLRTTLCFGYMVVRGAHRWPWGLLGNDYGWNWGWPV